MPLAALIGLALSSPAMPNEPFNRAPLQPKPFAELPLGSIKPQGWLKEELQRMAGGMTGNLDTLYPEVCGPRNAWLGGDGDTWERGPYWIDGLYPLAELLDDDKLRAKAKPWIEWTLNSQQPNGMFGPVEIPQSERTQAPPRGAQIHKPDDWWPRMVMIKVLQQHHSATGDERVVPFLTRYFQHQLRELPERPLHDPRNPESGSWWAAQRGGENLQAVLWLYNITGDAWLLDLADLIHEQTIPVTQWFTERSHVPNRYDQGPSLHCVNLAMMVKTPGIRWQQDGDDRHLHAIRQGLSDMRRFHGQPHGLFGGDEFLSGDSPSRGSELCTAVEMMFSLEKLAEITGDVEWLDRLEWIAYNALPAQMMDDHSQRQYFQQTNQVAITLGSHDFHDDGGARQVMGLTSGYPCCTANLHQGWPKLTQHLWMASRDGGIAAAAHAPSTVSFTAPNGSAFRIEAETIYPFGDTITYRFSGEKPALFPFHMRIPAWAKGTEVSLNGTLVNVSAEPGSFAEMQGTWKDGDTVTLKLPMELKISRWYRRSAAVERGPLLFAMPIASEQSEKPEPRSGTDPKTGQPRMITEFHATKPWNYALPESLIAAPSDHISVERDRVLTGNPWSEAHAPVRLTAKGIRLPQWGMERSYAADPPLSPVGRPLASQETEITLIPYGSTLLRIGAFPIVRN